MNKQQALNTFYSWASRVPGLTVRPNVVETGFSVELNASAVGLPEVNFRRFNGNQFTTVNAYDPGAISDKRVVYMGQINASLEANNIGGAGSFLDLGLVGLGADDLSGSITLGYCNPILINRNTVGKSVFSSDGFYLFTDVYVLASNLISGSTIGTGFINFVGFSCAL
jgi:hypothetical protein